MPVATLNSSWLLFRHLSHSGEDDFVRRDPDLNLFEEGDSMKKALTSVGIVFLIASFSAGCGSLDPRVEKQIELVGSELTDVSVVVDKVKIRVGQGLGEINGLMIANPEGYVATNAFEMEQLRMNFGIVSSLTGGPLVLDELVIYYPVVNLEKRPQEGSNLKDISDSTENNMAEADRKSAAEEPASKGKPGEPFRIAISRLVIEGVTLNVRLSDGTTRSGTLPGITLTDVGGDEGVTPGGLGLVVIGTMAGEMLKQAVARELIERAGNIKDALNSENILETLVDRLNLTPEQREKVRPAVENLSEALAATIDTWEEQGFIDRESLSGQLEPLLEKIRGKLAVVLDSEQVQALQGSLASLEEDAVEVIRFAVIEMISKRLGVTPEQAAQLRPMLRENLAAMSKLLSSFAAETGKSFEEFKAASDDLRNSLKARLRNVLDADQMKTLDALQDEIVERIRNASFVKD